MADTQTAPLTAPPASFTGDDGTLYTLNLDISVSRAKALQRFSLELAYDTSFRAIIETVDKGWEALDRNQLATGIHEFGRLRESLNAIGEGRLADLNIVGIFYVTPEENRLYSHAEQLKKLSNWEGLNASFFTRLAVLLLKAM